MIGFRVSPSTVILNTARNLYMFYSFVSKQNLQDAKGLPSLMVGGYGQCRDFLLVVGGLLQVARVTLTRLPE